MKIWLIILLFGFTHALQAQYSLQVQYDSCEKIRPSFQSDFTDSLSIIHYLQTTRLKLLGQGFAEASIDQVSFEKKRVYAKIHLGQKYSLAILNLQEIPVTLRPKKNRLSEKEVVFSPFALGQYMQDILHLATTKGYPVADVFLDSIRIFDGQLQAQLKLTKGPFIQYATPKTHGQIDIRPVFIQNYLHFLPNHPFNLADVRLAKKRINELDFVQLTHPPNIQLRGNEAIINLNLKEKKANQFNFLIGVLPNNDETKKLLLVGNVLVDFKNMLGFGEQLYFKFDQNRPQTQQLALKTVWPYPLNWPIGLDGHFNLYKRDTAYLDIKSQLAVRYFLGGSDYLKVFWQSTKSNLLSINKNQLIISKKLPTNLDFRSNIFGLEYGIEKLDNRLNPRKGWALKTRLGAGILTHPTNPKITEIVIPNQPDFSFQTLYDSLDQKSWEIRSALHVSTYIPIFKSSVIAVSNHTAWLYSPTTISQNQQYRIGGNHLLRGFDEESIFAALYNVSALEYRLLIGATSYLYAFGDYGLTQSPTQNVIKQSNFIGLGAGMSFQTKAGLFRISYALGKQDNNPLDTRSAKIHLGYQSVF